MMRCVTFSGYESRGPSKLLVLMPPPQQEARLPFDTTRLSRVREFWILLNGSPGFNYQGLPWITRT